MSDPTEIPGNGAPPPDSARVGTQPIGPVGGVSAGPPPPQAPRKDRRALLVGIQRYLDAGMMARPGTSAAVRQIGAILADPEHGGWHVECLLDDEPSEERRPMLSNLLERLEWLKKADEALLVLSGRVRGGLFMPRDARPTMIARTSISLGEISASLPKESSVIIDANVDNGAFPAASWVLAAGPRDGAETFPNDRGPTTFLSTVIRALQGNATSDADVVTARYLAEMVVREAHPAWIRGERDLVLARPGMRPTHCIRCGKTVSDPLAVYCPGCGSPMRAVEHLDGGRYRILRPLGAGGMGTVYLAYDTRLRVQRALKLLSVPAGLSPEDHQSLEQRLVQECRAAQALGERTGHVVKVYDVGYSPERGEPFLVMELLQGRTLGQKLADGRMTISGSIRFGRTVAETLGAAHEVGIVHRDLKPENVFLHQRSAEEPEYVKLLDFGLAKMTEADLKTQSGKIMGTLQYMPPEQLRGEAVDARADVFSLGAVLYECLSGERAVPGRTQGEIFRVLLDTGVRPLREICPDLPPKLLRLIDRCLALDPRSRPTNGREVAAALAEILAELDDSDALAHTVAHDDDGERAAAVRAVHAIEAKPASGFGELRVPRSTLLSTMTPAKAAGGAIALLVVLGVFALARLRGSESSTAPAPASAAVEPARLTDAGPLPPDAGRARPVAPPTAETAAEALPASPQVNPTLDGDFIVYRGGAPAERLARLVIDVTLSESEPPARDAAALARWARTTPSVRAWLQGRVDTAQAEPRGDDTLAIGRARFESERERARPASRVLPGVGALLFDPRSDGTVAIFERVRCGPAAVGDRLASAQWQTPGYGGGSCAASECAESLARALIKARQVGETTSLRLTLERDAAGEGAVRVDARCKVGEDSP